MKYFLLDRCDAAGRSIDTYDLECTLAEAQSEFHWWRRLLQEDHPGEYVTLSEARASGVYLLADSRCL
jgi:hypothetical protein